MGRAHLETILFVDDDPDIREIVAEALAAPGHGVLTASDGYDAIRILADNWISILITDVNMPGINGFELARQARVMRPNIHVIYFSVYPVEDARGYGPVYGTVLQ